MKKNHKEEEKYCRIIKHPHTMNNCKLSYSITHKLDPTVFAEHVGLWNLLQTYLVPKQITMTRTTYVRSHIRHYLQLLCSRLICSATHWTKFISLNRIKIITAQVYQNSTVLQQFPAVNVAKASFEQNVCCRALSDKDSCAYVSTDGS